MSRAVGTLILCVAMLAAACRRGEQPVRPAAPLPVETAAEAPPSATDVDEMIPIPDVAARCAAGDRLDRYGFVTSPKTEFQTGKPLHFTLWFEESPPGLRVGFTLRDEKGGEAARVYKDAEGRRTVTVTLDAAPARGAYRLEGFWGGNSACEIPIQIR